jgi:glucose-6-phosphate-specific signal transduction histidine kinase
MSIFILNWVFLLALLPVAFFWLRRAWRILVRRDFSEVALKKGVPPVDAERYAPYEMAINLIGGVVLVSVLVAVLGFQAMAQEDWIALAGSTLWVKLFMSFALSRHAHGGFGALGRKGRKGAKH